MRSSALEIDNPFCGSREDLSGFCLTQVRASARSDGSIHIFAFRSSLHAYLPPPRLYGFVGLIPTESGILQAKACRFPNASLATPIGSSRNRDRAVNGLELQDAVNSSHFAQLSHTLSFHHESGPLDLRRRSKGRSYPESL